MTVTVEVTGPKTRMPEPATFAGEVDNRLRAVADEARDRVVQTMRAEIPFRTGATRAATTGRVAQERRGFKIVVSNRINAHHLRFLQTGTGRYGPRRRKIPVRKRGYIPSAGIRPSGKGMRSQKVMSRMVKAAYRKGGPASEAAKQMREIWLAVANDIYRGHL